MLLTPTPTTQVIQNQLIPDEGPKMLPLLLPFTDGVTTEFDLDLQNFQARGFVSMIQTAFIDMSGITTGTLQVQMQTGSQIVIAKANTQGYYALLCPNPVKIHFIGVANMGKVSVILINVPIPGATWATQ